MVGRRAKRAATVALVLLTLSACSSDKPKAATPGATVPTAPPFTTTTDPYAVPAVIDAAYVNRVLAGLDEASGEVVRQVRSANTITPEAVDRLKALYVGTGRLQIELDSLQEALRRGFNGYVPNPGNVRTTVAELLTTKATCVFAKVDRDHSAVLATPNPVLKTQWIAIRPQERSQFNPTSWGYIYNGVERNLQRPGADPCNGF